MPTIPEFLAQLEDYSRKSLAIIAHLKGDAPADLPPAVATPAPQPSRFTDGKSAPDSLGRVELELIERLRAEFGDAPNGYRIPRLWYVPGVSVPQSIRGDYEMRVAGAGLNRGVAYTYIDKPSWFGKTLRAPETAIPDCVCWNGSLEGLEAKLRTRIAILLQEPPFKPNPDTGALDSVAGYLDLHGV